MQKQQSPQEYFRVLLLTVVGQAFSAAGYELEQRPVKWAGGLFRFSKRLNEGTTGYIEFQHLSYAEGASRFTVMVGREPHPPTPSPPKRKDSGEGEKYLPSFKRGLAALVVEDFGVAILPSAAHWWTYSNVNELGHALGEAGSLAVGYAMPYLSGELEPPDARG